MITEDCLNRVLPVVADSWAQLRRSDVDRLLNQIHYDNKVSLLVAAGIVATKRPDLQKQIDQSVEWITEERGWNEVVEPTITSVKSETAYGSCTLTALFSDFSERRLFSFYVDELCFSTDELVGLTVAQAHELRHSKDVAYLRS